MCVKKTCMVEDFSIKLHPWLCICGLNVYARAYVCPCACGGHTVAVASTESRRSPLRAWARDHDLGKCHSAYGGGSPVTHKAMVLECINAL